MSYIPSCTFIVLTWSHISKAIYPAALLMVLARRGVFDNSFENDQIGGFNKEIDKPIHGDEVVFSSPLIEMFAVAIKGPLLSSDSQLQTSTLDLVFHIFSSGATCLKKIQALVENNIADYVFEALRLSGIKFLDICSVFSKK